MNDKQAKRTRRACVGKSRKEYQLHKRAMKRLGLVYVLDDPKKRQGSCTLVKRSEL